MGMKVERTGSRASKRIGHGPAVAKAGGKRLRLVDAEAVVDLGEDLVDKRDIGAAAVGPPGVEPVGRHKDGRLAGQGPEPVVVRRHIVHVAAEPVEAEDEAVLARRVVVGRHLQRVLPVADVLGPAGRGRLAAARGPRRGGLQQGGGRQHRGDLEEGDHGGTRTRTRTATGAIVVLLQMLVAEYSRLVAGYSHDRRLNGSPFIYQMLSAKAVHDFMFTITEGSPPLILGPWDSDLIKWTTWQLAGTRSGIYFISPSS